ncbi:ZBED5 protein, partial [Polyodon spathula]|nr:ZBED5 protein [Polyodon spathula]
MGEDVFHIIDSFFSEHNLDWKSCTHLCTDGAASMIGRVKGLLAQIKKVNPDVEWNHCIIHREALASKRMSPELHNVLNDGVKVINFIESRPLNHRLFESLCHDSGTDHQQLLLHTDVRWLSRGKTLQRLFELRDEVSAFLSEHSHPLVAVFEDTNWVARLAYLADVFSKLNNLNLTLQGKGTHILNMYDKACGFMKKIKLWERKCEDGDISCFQQLDTYLSTYISVEKFHTLNSNLESLARQPTELAKLHKWTDLKKLEHKDNLIPQTWNERPLPYGTMQNSSFALLTMFGSTYMSEQAFSHLNHIKKLKSEHPNNRQELKMAAAEAWQSISNDYTNSLVSSMGHRLHAVIASMGYATKY